MVFEMPGEGLGAGIFIVGSPDNAEFQMGGTIRIPDFQDRDLIALLIADQRQPRGGQQGDAFLVLDECDDPVAADIMTADSGIRIGFAEFSPDKFLEILTGIITSDQKCFMTQVRPGHFQLCRQRVVGGEGGHDTVAPKGRDPQGWSQIAACDDREIDLPALEPTQKPFACVLGITEDDIRMCGAELRCEGGKSSRQDAGLDADGDLAVLALTCPLRASIHASHVVQDRLGPADELLTEDSRRGTSRGAGEQPDIQPLLKVVEGSTDSRLSGVQEPRRAVDTAVLCDCPYA